jgi:hypothetical protein
MSENPVTLKLQSAHSSDTMTNLQNKARRHITQSDILNSKNNGQWQL